MTGRYPIERTNERVLPADYRGPIDIWDIDKTYLESEFESIRDLLRGAFERAIDKRTKPGMRAVLRALRRGTAPGSGAGAPVPVRTPLYFVSASPPELRRVLEGKMLIDGVEYDGIAFKDQLGLMKARRFRELRRHVAYKLAALFEYRAEWPAGAREWLYGDDAETDALIYSLYAQVRAGTLGGEALAEELAKHGVARGDRRLIATLAALAAEKSPPPAGGSVEAIYIVRVSKAPKVDPAAFPLVRPVSGAVELAVDLARRGRIPESAIAEVEKEVAGA